MRKFGYEEMLETIVETRMGNVDGSGTDFSYLMEHRPDLVKTFALSHPVYFDVLNKLIRNKSREQKFIVEVLENLSAHGIPMSNGQWGGPEPLFTACEHKLSMVVKHLLSSGADIAAHGEDALVLAFEYFRRDQYPNETEETEEVEKIIDMLVSAGVDINGRDFTGALKVLHFFPTRRNERFLVKLVKLGLKMSVKDFSRVSDPATATAILESECSKDYPVSGIFDHENGKTLLMKVKNIDMLKWYLDGPGKERFHMSVNDIDKEGKTVLDNVCLDTLCEINYFSAETESLIDEFVSRGARPELKNARIVTKILENCSPETAYLMAKHLKNTADKNKLNFIPDDLSYLFNTFIERIDGCTDNIHERRACSMSQPYVRETIKMLLDIDGMFDSTTRPKRQIHPFVRATYANDMSLLNFLLDLNLQLSADIQAQIVENLPRYKNQNNVDEVLDTIEKIFKAYPGNKRLKINNFHEFGRVVVSSGERYVAFFLEHTLFDEKEKIQLLHEAIKQDSLETIRLVLDSFGGKSYKESLKLFTEAKTPFTLLSLALENYSYPHIVKFFIDNGVKIDAAKVVGFLSAHAENTYHGYRHSMYAFKEKFEILSPAIFNEVASNQNCLKETSETLIQFIKNKSIPETCKKMVAGLMKQIASIDRVASAQITSNDFEFGIEMENETTPAR